MESEKIPLSRPSIDARELAAVQDVLESGQLAHGPANDTFEQHLAALLGVKHVVALSSGTAALFLALKAHNITGEVLVPSFTFTATAAAIVAAGAIPVWVDVDYRTCNMDVDKMHDSIGPSTEAIMPVHFAGQPCEMERIMEIARRNKLLVIEDSAETLGATCDGKQAGSFGVGCFSFFPTKMITTGEGGALATNNDWLANQVRRMSSFGIDLPEERSVPWVRDAASWGFNFRMSAINAAIGSVQIVRLPELLKRRKHLADLYRRELNDSVNLTLPYVADGCTHAWQMFTIKVAARLRDVLVARLRSEGIEASVHFTPAVHKQVAYRGLYKSPCGLETTNALETEIVTLPLYPDMADGVVWHVANRVKTILNILSLEAVSQ